MSRLRGLLVGDSITPETWSDVEESLIAGDIGASLAMDVVERARRNVTSEGATAAVRRELSAVLLPREPRWDLVGAATPPAVVLIVGVDGTGKTATTGKLPGGDLVAGRRVILAAAHSVRGDAEHQRRIWAD